MSIKVTCLSLLAKYLMKYWAEVIVGYIPNQLIFGIISKFFVSAGMSVSISVSGVTFLSLRSMNINEDL